MIARLLLVVVALLGFAASASAHRLDEYLEATTIALDRTDVTLRFSLTPGTSLAPQVLAAIDPDHDGTLTGVEQRRYAARVNTDANTSLWPCWRP